MLNSVSTIDISNISNITHITDYNRSTDIIPTENSNSVSSVNSSERLTPNIFPAQAAISAPSSGVPLNPDPVVSDQLQRLQVRRSVQNRLQLLQVELNLNSQQIRDALFA